MNRRVFLHLEQDRSLRILSRVVQHPNPRIRKPLLTVLFPLNFVFGLLPRMIVRGRWKRLFEFDFWDLHWWLFWASYEGEFAVMEAK